MITAHKIGYYGQLGNQVFQYATLIGVSEKTGFEVVLPAENTQIRQSGFEWKPLFYGLSLLDCFQIPDKLVTNNEISAVIKNTYEEKQHNFNDDVFKIKDNTSFIGQFETEKYFKHADTRVRKSLTFKPEIIEHSKERFSKITRNKKNVALHVRQVRKHASFIQNHHPFIDISYYIKAISFFNPQDFDVLVFSDDLEWSRENIKGPNIFFCDWVENYNRPDFIDLCMMTFCDHFIIANSTFGWWGAWLSNNTDKRVIAPNVWFGPALKDKNTSDIIPETWIKI